MSDIAGRIRPTPPTLHYVVLHHTGVAGPHFDLMFEATPGAELTTWRSPTWPIEAETVLTKLADHRREYLTYEGPVSQNRGQVRRVESGAYHLRKRTDTCWLLTFKTLVSHRQLEFTLASEDQWHARPAPI